MRAHRLLAVLLLLSAAATWPPLAWAQSAPGTATIRGIVSTQRGEVRLPGATVTLSLPGRQPPVGQAVSDGRGEFALPAIPPGRYQLTAALDGFETVTLDRLVVTSSAVDRVTLDLPIAAVTEAVDVKAPDASAQQPTARERLSGTLLEEAPLQGDSFAAVLPLAPGVVRTLDGRISMKGGQATQASLQVSSTNVTDPATGNLGFELPVDAVEQVEALSNPYAAEFGRFSTGLARVETYRGTNRWHVTPNNFIPSLRWRRGEWGKVDGVRSFSPRLSVGGPLIRDRLAIEQSLQIRRVDTENQSLPQDERVRLRSLDVFTRLDATPPGRHAFTVTLSAYPRTVDYVNLGRFVPPSATVDLVQRGAAAGAALRTVVGATTLVESTLGFRTYDLEMQRRGDGEMAMTPAGLSGTFFNAQARDTWSWQWVETMTRFAANASGEHIVKVGVDLLASGYRGRSSSLPVVVRDAGGAALERVEFGPPTRQQVSSVDTALFAQDRWRVNDRLILELGMRLDRDGVLERWVPGPRIGGAFSLLPDARAVLRGGIGVFAERTPLNVGAFTSFEPRTVWVAPIDGLLPAEGPLRVQHVVAPDQRTPRSATWNVQFDQRVGNRIFVRLAHLGRHGRHERLLDVDETAPALVLATRGRSRYRETELTVRGVSQDETRWAATYVHSRARADLNAYDLFFGNARQPLVRPNEYGPTDADVPHRLVLRGTVSPRRGWAVTSLAEVRSGFPFSAVDAGQRFVGGRNQAGRFPNVATVDVDLTRRVRAWRWQADVGLRIYNLLRTHVPREVQRNLAAADYGAFYNPIPREVRLILRVRR